MPKSLQCNRSPPSCNFQWTMRTFLVLLIISFGGFCTCEDAQGPSFLKEPPSRVDFSNTTGVTVDCAAEGVPRPSVSWVSSSGEPVTSIPGLRQQLPGGALMFPAFAGADFRQDVHAATYRCVASNSAGVIISRDTHIRAVVPQAYEIQVFDVYAIVKTTAVFKCQVPSFLDNYVKVTFWLRDEVLIIEPTSLMDGKYAVLPTGELHIRDVNLDDSGSSYRCHVKHQLTGETHFCSVAGRLYVTDPQANVQPRITDNMGSVHVNEGDTVILPCVAQGHPAPKAEWFAKLNKRQLFPLHIGERVQQTSGILIIHRAQTSDSGTYVCDVSNEAGSDRAETTVTVTAPLSVSVKPAKQVVDIGKPATFRCLMSGFPVTSVTWYKDGKKLSTDSGKTVSDEIIYIESVQVLDKGMYQCFVNNNLESAQAVGQLLLGDAAPEFVGVFEDNTLQPGATATLICVATGSPLPRVTWSVDGMPLSGFERVATEERVDDDGSVASMLNVTDVRWEDGGVYRCTAKNIEGQSEHEARLNVYGPPAIRKMPRVTAVAGEDIRLNCLFYGYPIDSIVWEKDGRALPFNLRQVAFPNGTVVIRKVQRASDTGKYSCKISSGKGQTAREEVELAVMVPPKITPFSFQDELVREGMRARLQCVVSEGDAPLTLRWTKDGQAIPASLGVTVRDLDEYSSILSISHVTPRYNGNYTCIATNEAAAARHTAELFVNVPPKIIPFAFLDDQFYMGMRAHITCAVSQGDLPISFKWLKDGQEIPPNLGVITRNYDQHANSLHIESVTSKHTGNYTCITSNVAASVNYSAPLLVHVAPKIVPFSFQSDHLFEGVLARISCVVYQGDLPLMIQWLKDGQPMPPSLDISVRKIDEFSSILTIDSVERRHSGNYTCIAQNTAAIVNYTAELIVNVPPKIVPFAFQDEHLLDGMLVRVSCVVSRGDLPLSIRWEKDSYPIPPDLGVTIREFDEYSSVLSIDPLSPAHSGNYTCIASNHAATASYTAPLVVYVPPRWIIEPRDNSVLLGNSLNVDCQADGFPLPRITWMKGQGNTVGEHVEPVENTPDVRVLANGTLSIVHVKDYHRGHYFCKASNGIGDGLSTALFINVLIPPHFDVKFRNQTFRGGEGFRLDCMPDGDQPFTFTWKKDGVILDPALDVRYKIQSPPLSSISDLSIMEATRVDTGVYTCIAQNNYGVDETSLQIIVFEPPDPPADIGVQDIGNRSVEVTWTPPFDGHSRINKYVIEYNRLTEEGVDGQAELAVGGKEASAILHSMKPATRYQLRMFAENDIGISNPGNFVEFVTVEEAPGGVPLEIEADAVDSSTIVVLWKPPKKDLWHGKLKGYYVGYKVLGSSEPVGFQSLEIPPDEPNDNLTAYITDLKKFTKYSIVVLAYNDKGKGPASAEVNVMTAEDVPSQAPMDVRCTALTSQSIHVSWQPPPPHTVNGILRGYKVLFMKVAKTQSGDDSPIDSKTTAVVRTTLHELEKSSNYSIQVLAFTKVGDGVPSTSIYCLTLDDVPDVPANVKAFPASKESVLVAWKSPLRSNGVVNKYYVYAKHVDDAEEDAMRHAVPATALYYELAGLKPFQTYEFWVTAATSIGESPRSKMVSQVPEGPVVPAKIAAFDATITTLWKKYIKLPCKAVGTPAPERIWMRGGVTVKENDRLKILPDGTLLVKYLEWSDSGNYTCRVKNDVGADEVVYVVSVLAPPSTPNLMVGSTTPSSIALEWKLESDGGASIQGYTLNFKRDLGHWEQVDLTPDMDSYSLNGLKCGNQYLLYMTAFNKIGTGSPSAVINVTTNGTAPERPPKEALIEEDMGSVTIHLQAWNTESCPITSFVLEYRQKPQSGWKLLADNLKAEQENFVITDLAPATPYSLRVTAHNGAGSTVATYDFVTLSRQGVGEDTRGILFYLDLRIIIPVAALVFLVVVVLSILCICASRRDSAARKMKGMDGHNANGRPNLHGDSTVSSFAFMHRNRTSNDCSALRPESQEKPIPYATYHLPNMRTSSEFTTFGQQRNPDQTSSSPPSQQPSQTPQNEVEDTNSHAMQHFTRPQPTVSGYPSPNGKMRTIHPVAIPTAPTASSPGDSGNGTYDSQGSPINRRKPDISPKLNMVTMETRFSPTTQEKLKDRGVLVLPGQPPGTTTENNTSRTASPGDRGSPPSADFKDKNIVRFQPSNGPDVTQRSPLIHQ